MIASAAIAPAFAAEIALNAPGSLRPPFEALLPDFEKRSGHKIKAAWGSAGAARERVMKGEPFDVSILQPPTDIAVASGNILKNSERPIASIPVGVAFKAGAAKPDVSSAEALKATLLVAKSIAALDPASGSAAGVIFEQTLAKLGVASEVKPKVRIAQGGRGAMELVAKGEAEIGLTFISEIIGEPGVAAAGPLPREVAAPIQLVAFMSSRTKDVAPARDLVIFLSGEDASKVYRERGMQPAR